MSSLFKSQFAKLNDLLFPFRGSVAVSKSGFSLIEVLVASSILGIIGLAISSIA